MSTFITKWLEFIRLGWKMHRYGALTVSFRGECRLFYGTWIWQEPFSTRQKPPSQFQNTFVRHGSRPPLSRELIGASCPEGINRSSPAIKIQLPAIVFQHIIEHINFGYCAALQAAIPLTSVPFLWSTASPFECCLSSTRTVSPLFH